MAAPRREESTRERLLQAAASLISEDVDQNVSVREICGHAGVQLPTLYHYFQSKRGLIDAVTAYGSDELTRAMTAAAEAIPDDVGRRVGAACDAHVEYGLTHPSFYVLMYGRVAPGRRAPGWEGPAELLARLLAPAEAAGALAVTSEVAVEHILATLTGLVLHLISKGDADPRLARAMRDAARYAILAAEGV
ncbi:MAG: TetR/AcrR family transcriptional regulator [Microbacterium sp.]|uniref:TetR/AcrR family transcriptional regulator n=1 Tax=Microbacterium sp. TaxID=51671 RepID=UPI0039E22B59